MIHASTVNKLNEMRLTAMADACRGLVPADAASDLARIVLDVARRV